MIPLSLGPITFDETSLEPPEALATPTTAMLAVHDFPGGIRTIQAFGAFPDPIKFRGKISRPDMLERMQQFKGLLAAGQPITLSYGPLAWYGVMERFVPIVVSQWRAEYEIEFIPQIDLTLPPSDSGDLSDESQVSSQMSDLQGQTDASPNGKAVDPYTGIALDGSDGNLVAKAGSPLANALDQNPEAFSAGAYDFGPVSTAGSASDLESQGTIVDPDTGVATDGSDGNLLAKAGSPLAQQLDANPGAFTAGGIAYGPSYAAAADGTPLPTQILEPTGNFMSVTSAALASAGGVVANVTSAAALAVGRRGISRERCYRATS